MRSVPVQRSDLLAIADTNEAIVFDCTCENGHRLDVSMPVDSSDAADALADAKCHCGASLFTAEESRA
jgi:hypothetical protein